MISLFLLMNHRGDVDLRHYNTQSEEDLKRVFDKTIDYYIINMLM